MNQTRPAPASAELDAKMREIWQAFEKRWIREKLQAMLPPVRMRSMGCEFLLHPADNFTELRMWETGLPPEHEATAAIAADLAGRDAVIVDVGANAGAFSLPLLIAAGEGARAVVFEPNPVMRARLEENIALNGLAGRVMVFDCAVGDAEGRSAMFLPDNGNLGQGRVLLDYGDDGRVAGLDEVRIRPLADCLAEAGVDRIDFLKVDVEGLEDRVICPLLQSQDAPRPDNIYFEVAHDGDWHYPLIETLGAAGYRAAQDYGKNRLYLKGRVERSIQ